MIIIDEQLIFEKHDHYYLDVTMCSYGFDNDEYLLDVNDGYGYNDSVLGTIVLYIPIVPNTHIEIGITPLQGVINYE